MTKKKFTKRLIDIDTSLPVPKFFGFPTSTVDLTEPHPRWYVAYCRPHMEVTAEVHLNEQGFETYFPRYRKQRRHARRTETVSVPLFSRYLFVGIDDLNVHRWRAINSTCGITRLICDSDDRPTLVPVGVVEALKNREDADGYFNPGLRATFASFTNVLSGMNDRERNALLLKMLDRS
jgi:transcription antitermination factor NusG